MTRPSSSANIRRVRKGIFEVAFEQPQSFWVFWVDCYENLQLIHCGSGKAYRLLKDLFWTAPMAFLLYVISALWPCLMSAFYLWSIACFLEVVCRPLVSVRQSS